MAQQCLFVSILRVVQERAYIFFENFAVLVQGAAAEALEALEALALSLSSTLGLTSLVVYKDVLTYNCIENGSKSVYEVALLYNRIPCYTLDGRRVARWPLFDKFRIGSNPRFEATSVECSLWPAGRSTGAACQQCAIYSASRSAHRLDRATSEVAGQLVHRG